MNFIIPQNPQSANLARQAFEASGISVAEWARFKGFSADLVYQVLDGRRRCLRGKSHQIAVELGLKDGQVMTVDQLALKLANRSS